ncbi:hypothetical protein AADA15_12815 [Phycobacter sp. 'Weihai']
MSLFISRFLMYRIVLAAFSVMVILALGAGTSKAELRVSLKPDVITAESTSALVIEASSLRLDITVVRPDFQQRAVDESGAIDQILGKAPIYDESSAKRTLATHFTLGLLEGDSGELQRQTSQSRWLRDPNLFQIVNGITQEGWRGAAEGGPPLGPSPDLVFIVELDLPTALLVENALQKLSEETTGSNDGLSVFMFHEIGRSWITAALDASRVQDQVVSSNGTVTKVPVTTQSQTVLGWLYETTLDLTRRPGTGARANVLQGCSVSPENVIRDLYVPSDEAVANARPASIQTFYQDFLDPNAGRLSVRRLIGLAESAKGGVTGFLVRGSAGAATWFDPNTLMSWVSQKGVPLAKWTEYRTALLNGRSDPIVTDIYICAGKVRARGHSMISNTIFERSLGYRAATEVLRARATENGARHPVPRFFVAAETVTKLLGIGMVDPLELNDADDFKVLIDTVDELVVDEACAGLTGAESLMVGAASRRLLRLINWELYHNVNLPLIGYLIEEGRYNQPFSMQDPLTGRTLTPDMHPMFPKLNGTPIPFDLRMVLAEQGYIETRLPELVDLNSAEGKVIVRELSLSQQALYCLELSKILQSDADKAHRQYLTSTQKYLQAAVDAKLFDKEELTFSNYWYRVATGSAMVMIAHGKSVDTFLQYLRQLMDLRRKNEPVPSAEVLKPSDEERITALMRRGQDQLHPNEVRDVRRAAELLLSDSFGEDVFWNCSVGAEQTPVAGVMDLPRRANTVTTSGGTSLILAFELGAGGALNPDATPDGSDPAICAALRARRDQFDAWVTTGQAPLLQSYWSSEKHIVVLGNSTRLRSLVANLAPYLRVQQNAGSPLDSNPEWVIDRLQDAKSRQAALERRLTLLKILQPYSDKQPEVLAALGITKATFDKIAASSKARLMGADSIGGMDGTLGKGGDRQTYSEAFGAAALDNFLTEFEAPLAALFRPMEKAWQIEVTEPSPAKPAAGRFAQNTFFLTPTGASPAAGINLNDVDLGGLALGGDVGLRLSETSAEDVYRGDLVVRLPSLRSPAGAGAQGSCGVQVFDPGSTVTDSATCAASKLLGDEAIVDEPELASLGITFRNLRAPPTCDEEDIANCGLQVSGAVNEDDIIPDPARLTKTLRQLGLPEFVNFSLNRVDFGDDGSTQTMTLVGNLTVARIALGEINVPLRDGGTWKALLPEMIKAADDKIRSDMAHELGRFESFLIGLRLPAKESDYNASPVRFGPMRRADGSPDVSFGLDWTRPSLGMRVMYELSARLPQEPDSTALSVRAGVEFVFGSDGLKKQRIVFEKSGMDEVNARIAGYFATFIDTLGGPEDAVIAVAPEVKGGQLFFNVSYEAQIEGCPVRAAVSVPMGSDFIAAAQSALGSEAETLLGTAAACVAETLTTEVNTTLHSQSIDVLGVPFTAHAANRVLQAAMDQQIPLQFTLEVDPGPGSPIGTCEGLQTKEVNGIRLKAENGVKLDFRGMRAIDQETLGHILRCRITTVTPEALQPYFELRNVKIGHDLIAADFALNDVPLIGSITLPRQNFLRLDSDVETLLKQALGAAAAKELREHIADVVSDLEVPGMGTVNFDPNTLDIDLFSDQPRISAGIRVEAFGIVVPGSVEIRLDRGLDAVRIAIDESQLQAAAIEGVVAQLLDYVPEDTVKIENPRFGRLDDLGREWGLVFGVKAEVPIEPGLVVGASRVVISESGVSIGEKITGGMSAPIYLGVVAMSKVLVSLYTGENGGKSGLEIGADLTAFEPQLAHLVKLRALLDLSEIDKPKFTAKGDLVVLSALEIFKSTGVLDLSQVRATLDAKTTDAIRDVLSFDADLDLDGGNKRFLAKSELGVLGIDLSRSDLTFCVKACGDGSGREHLAELTVWERMLIGEGNVNAITDLDFKNPNVGAGLALNLFGWKPGGANLDADLRRVQVSLRFLGISTKAVTPSVETMTPQYLIDLLKSLLDISLEDLLNIDPTNITVSVMSGDGSTQTVHDGESGGDAAKADDGEENHDHGTHTGTIAVLQNEEGAPPPQGDGQGAPQPTPWGQQVAANICEKIIGTPGSTELRDAIDARYYIHSVRQGDQIRPAFSWEIRKPEDTWGWWRLYTQSTIQELCEKKGVAYQLNKALVGTDRGYVGWRRCEDTLPSAYRFRTIPNVVPGAVRPEPLDGAINLSTYLACVEIDGWTLSIWGDWFLGDGGQTYLIAPRCPSGEILAQAVANSAEIQRLCVGSGLIEVAKPENTGYAVADLLTADVVYQLLVSQVAPKVAGLENTLGFSQMAEIVLPNITGKEDRVYQPEVWKETDASGATLNWHIMMREAAVGDGWSLVTPLVLAADDPLARYLQRPAILAHALSLWLTHGRRPEILSAEADDYLVLGVLSSGKEQRGQSRTAKPTHETHSWIWQSAPGASLHIRELSFPLSVPAPGGSLRLEEGKTPAKAAMLAGIWEEVRRLPKSDGGWEVLMGLDARKQSQSWAFVEQGQDKLPNQKIHILLDQVTSKQLALDTLWDTSLSLDGAEILPHIRRRCVTGAEIATALGAVQSPSVPSDEMLEIGAVRLALTQPAIFDRRHTGLRALPDPLVRLPNSTCPEPFQ